MTELSPEAGRPADAYTPWLNRVLAFVIDLLPVAALQGIGYGLLLGTRETICAAGDSGYDRGELCTTAASTLGQVAFAVAWVLAVVFVVWNYGYKQGTTGSSFGKGLLNFKVVGENTGRPIGFVMSIVRQVAHAADAVICYIGFLFPLWDAKRQTLADKLIKTICVPL
ncbi:RDD family protein [Mycobacterium sp. NPDC003323]